MIVKRHYVAWYLQHITFALFLRIKYNVKAIWETKKPKGNYLLLANHACYFDPWFVGYHSPKPVCYMTNEEGMQNPIIRTFGEWTGSFPKKKNQFDAGAVKEALSRLRKGRVVGIFPEGDRSWDGETAPIFFSIVKLVRKGRAPLLLARLSGNYLTKPRWVTYPRKGEVTVHFKALSLEEIDAMSDEELHKIISEYLYNNDIKTIQKLNIPFKGKSLAHNIQKVLWLCPTCKQHDTLYGQENKIKCNVCSSVWNIDGQMRISPDGKMGKDLKDWMDWQQESITQNIQKASPDTVLTNSASYTYRYAEDSRHFTDIGDGVLELTPSILKFTPNGATTPTFQFDPKQVKNIMIEFFDTLDFYYQGIRHQFDYHNRNAIKWIHHIHALQSMDLKS